MLRAGLGRLPPWEWNQNNWGCAERGWGGMWAFNQLAWWDYNANFRRPPFPESCNWFDIQRGDANASRSVGSPGGRLLSLQSPFNRTASTSQECFSRRMKLAHSYLSNCFLSLSPPLLICLSFSVWSNCSLFPTPPPSALLLLLLLIVVWHRLQRSQSRPQGK